MSIREKIESLLSQVAELQATNAEQVGAPFLHELHRIIIHGLLHLTGQADKTPETKAQMTAKEEDALAKINILLQNTESF